MGIEVIIQIYIMILKTPQNELESDQNQAAAEFLFKSCVLVAQSRLTLFSLIWTLLICHVQIQFRFLTKYLSREFGIFPFWMSAVEDFFSLSFQLQ